MEQWLSFQRLGRFAFQIYLFIDSAALRFIPVADLEKEGCGDQVARFEDEKQTADGQ